MVRPSVVVLCHSGWAHFFDVKTKTASRRSEKFLHICAGLKAVFSCGFTAGCLLDLKKTDDLESIEKDGRKIDEKEEKSRIKGKFKTKPLQKDYQGEDIPNNPNNWLGGHGQVKYLTDAELPQYKVNIQNGKLYDANGNLFDTSKANTWDGKKRAIFIIDEKGDMYVSNYQKAREFHHSSLGRGKPVAMAGEIEVANGNLNYMSNRSGHYWPTKEFMDQSIEHLSEQGIDFSNVKTHLE